MRIAINCRSFLKHNYTGIGRYAYNLVQSLCEVDQVNEYWLYAQKKYFDFKRQLPRVPARNFHVKVDWLGHGLARTLRDVDLYHAPSLESINIVHSKIVVTIHDLVYKTYPAGHTQQTIDLTEAQLQRITEQADKIICCSRSTMHDLCRYFPIAADKVCMVYQGVDKKIFFPLDEQQKLQAAEMLRHKGIPQRFILFVGTIEPRKNLQNLLLAFAEIKSHRRYPGKLVVVGMKGWMVEGLKGAIAKLKLQQDVIFPGYVPDDELRSYYNLTDVFVFPSFYEGFGFPIVEAFSCGAPVITSNVSSCPEIAADGALLADPYNPKEIEDGIMQAVEDSILRKSLQNNGQKRAADFSFRKTAEETLAVYRQFVGSSNQK
jgi:glycosyltransferase involved in cell wall biosynthesis